MALDRSSFGAGLKEIYLPPFRDQVNHATVMLDQIKNNDDVEVSGKNFIVPLVSRRHRGVTSRSGASKAANKLPTASKQEYKVATYSEKYHYARIEVDGPTMRSSKTDAGSFARAFDIEMKGASTAMSDDLNRQIFGDGTNALATVTATEEDVTEIAVDSTKFLDKEQTVFLAVHSTGAAIAADPDVQVSAILNTTTVELDTKVTLGTTHAIFSERSDSSSSPYRNALTGLQAIVLDGNVTNMGTSYVGLVDRDSEDYFNANVLSNSGTLRPISIGLMQQAVIASQQSKYGGNTPNLAVTNGDLWSSIGVLLVQDKRFRGDQMTLDGGWQYLEFSGVKIVWDKDAPDDMIFWLDLAHLFWMTQAEIQFMDDDGSILHRVTDYDSYEATLLCDKELGTDKPSAHTLLTDLDINIT